MWGRFQGLIKRCIDMVLQASDIGTNTALSSSSSAEGQTGGRLMEVEEEIQTRSCTIKGGVLQVKSFLHPS